MTITTGTSTAPSGTLYPGNRRLVAGAILHVDSGATSTLRAAQPERFNAITSNGTAGNNVRVHGFTKCGTSSVDVASTLSASKEWMLFGGEIPPVNYQRGRSRSRSFRV
jgi:hypothetical protein